MTELHSCPPRAKAAGGRNVPRPVQEAVLTGLSFQQVQVTLFLLSEGSVQGKIVWFDDYTLLLWTKFGTHLIHKRTIAFIEPG